MTIIPIACLRAPLRCHVVRPISRTLCHRRHFHQSVRTQAEESSDSLIANIKNTSLFKQIADKPEALQALSEFAKLLQDNGIDTSGRAPPSTMQMFKLAANAEFREGAKRVVVELKKAGVDLNSKEAMAEIMKMRGK